MKAIIKKKKFFQVIKDQKGQGVMEYLIITSLVGIFCLVAVKQFGTVIETRIDRMKSKIVRNINIQ